jgi:hypothetical protein
MPGGKVIVKIERNLVRAWSTKGNMTAIAMIVRPEVFAGYRKISIIQGSLRVGGVSGSGFRYSRRSIFWSCSVVSGSLYWCGGLVGGVRFCRLSRKVRL